MRGSYTISGKHFAVISEEGVYALLPFANRKRLGTELREWLAREVFPFLREDRDCSTVLLKADKAPALPPATATGNHVAQEWLARARANAAAFGELLRLFERRNTAKEQHALAGVMEEAAESILAAAHGLKAAMEG